MAGNQIHESWQMQTDQIEQGLVARQRAYQLEAVFDLLNPICAIIRCAFCPCYTLEITSLIAVEEG